MVAAVLLLALAQSQAPTVTVTVSQDRLAVGEAVVYMVEAVSRSAAPTRILVEPVTGFQVVGRIERSELSSAGPRTRATVLELHLRALQPGRWRIGPARVIQGTDTVEARAIAVQVEDAGIVSPVTLTPRVQRLLQRIPPPVRGTPSVTLLVSAEAARIGEQVDIVTAAWFPRDVREQLSRPPTLQPPVVEGVWSAPQATPVTIASSRTIGGVQYDLFVAHQTVFPLVPGRVTVPPATLKYTRPLGLRLFGRDELYALQSRPVSFEARPLPVTGRPDGFAGAVGIGLRLERRLSASTATVGQTLTVDYILAGTGNTALWPPPEVAWPAGVRAYRERVEEKVSAAADGTLGGSKIFRFLVVPDSVGVLRLPALRYPYFDLVTGEYREAAIAPASIAILAARDAAAGAALPPPLLPATAPPWWWRLANPLPDWAWLLLLALPPFAIVAYSRWPRRARPARDVSSGETLALAEARLETSIDALVPARTRRDPPALAAALRAAGVNAETVAAVNAARERLQSARYGPHSQIDQDDLRREVSALAERLAALRHRWQGETVLHALLLGATVVAGAMAAGTASVAAQTPAAEQLYRDGALHAAVDNFERRARAEPAVAAHWYGLGASYYRLGSKGHAASAWLHARRLAPREAVVRRALQLTPAPDAVSARRTWVPPIRPEELLLAGLCGWFIAWLGWAGRPRLRDRWTVLLVFSGLAVTAGLALRFWYRQPIAIADGAPELRLSPHGQAPVLARLETGGAVRILQTRGDWLLVRTPDDKKGWLPAGAAAPIGD